jgi:catechol 2,3-dioxygenase-like lactoylglutathione lyase family enzyme
MKLRTGEPWIPAPDYAHTLKGLSANLIVRDIRKAVDFQTQVLGVSVVYSDIDFAVIQGYGCQWMLHADHTYRGHPLEDMFEAVMPRGAGIELRLHGCDPDKAVTAALAYGFKVLSGAADKPYKLREAHLMDADGYVWVPDIPVKNETGK